MILCILILHVLRLTGIFENAIILGAARQEADAAGLAAVAKLEARAPSGIRFFWPFFLVFPYLLVVAGKEPSCSKGKGIRLMFTNLFHLARRAERLRVRPALEMLEARTLLSAGLIDLNLAGTASGNNAALES